MNTVDNGHPYLFVSWTCTHPLQSTYIGYIRYERAMFHHLLRPVSIFACLLAFLLLFIHLVILPWLDFIASVRDCLMINISFIVDLCIGEEVYLSILSTCLDPSIHPPISPPVSPSIPPSVKSLECFQKVGLFKIQGSWAFRHSESKLWPVGV